MTFWSPCKYESVSRFWFINTLCILYWLSTSRWGPGGVPMGDIQCHMFPRSCDHDDISTLWTHAHGKVCQEILRYYWLCSWHHALCWLTVLREEELQIQHCWDCHSWDPTMSRGSYFIPWSQLHMSARYQLTLSHSIYFTKVVFPKIIQNMS